MDWFVLTAPVVLLPIILLAAFVGCMKLDTQGTAAATTARVDYKGVKDDLKKDFVSISAIWLGFGNFDDADGLLAQGEAKHAFGNTADLAGDVYATPIEEGIEDFWGIPPGDYPTAEDYEKKLASVTSVTCICTLTWIKSPGVDPQLQKIATHASGDIWRFELTLVNGQATLV